MEPDELTNALEPILIQLTGLIEALTELIPGLLENPVGLLILLFVVPTLFKFGFGIIGAVFGFIANLVSGIFHIIYQILISPITITRFIRHQRKHRSKKPANDDKEDIILGYKGRVVMKEPVINAPYNPFKKKKKSEEEDLAASLKTNLLDE